ncbi:HSP70 [Acrasis kona]|uniref:HSP70 n=1 Tax=Acrasis kona TaxID=1008807 RepID=A0AAW2YTB6_9EUKA
MVERRGTKYSIATNKTIKKPKLWVNKSDLDPQILMHQDGVAQALDRKNGWELSDEIEQCVQEKSNFADKKERVERNRLEKKKQHEDNLLNQKQKQVKRLAQTKPAVQESKETTIDQENNDIEEPDHGWITVRYKGCYDVDTFKKRENGKDVFVTKTKQQQSWTKMNGEKRSYKSWDKEGSIERSKQTRRNERDQADNIVSGRYSNRAI